MSSDNYMRLLCITNGCAKVENSDGTTDTMLLEKWLEIDRRQQGLRQLSIMRLELPVWSPVSVGKLPEPYRALIPKGSRLLCVQTDESPKNDLAERPFVFFETENNLCDQDVNFYVLQKGYFVALPVGAEYIGSARCSFPRDKVSVVCHVYMERSRA